jgi:tetratricopeptide (TPR) repeat protein
MKVVKFKLKKLTPIQAIGVVLVLLVLAGVGYIVRNVLRDKAQSEAIAAFTPLMQKVKEYDSAKDADRKILEDYVAQIDSAYKKVYERSKKSLILSVKGELLGKGGRVTAAVEAFSEAEKLDSTNFRTYLEAGKLFQRQNRFMESNLAFNKALANLPPGLRDEEIEIHYYLGISLEGLNDLDRAQLAFEKVKNIATNYNLDSDIIRYSITQYNKYKRE